MTGLLGQFIQAFRDMEQRNQVSAKALLYVLIAEICAIISLRSWDGSKHIAIGFIFATLCLFIIIIRIYIQGKRDENKPKYEFKSLIITKLLSNAIVPSILGVLYLFFFIIHIGWLSDSSYNLFLPKEYSESIEILISLFVGSIGMSVLILFFPSGQDGPDDNATKVFVSGISLISSNTATGKPNDSLTPLVKILREVEENDKFFFCILLSDGYTKTEASTYNRVVDGIKQYYNIELQKYYAKKCTENDIMQKKMDEFSKKTVRNQLIDLINYVAKNRFPEKEWMFSENFNIDVRLTDEAVDYNVFETCYAVLDSELRKYDKPQYKLFFNITPGTGIIGSLMTLMSIKGNRRLFYYPQFVGGDTDIREADKSKVPLKNLLSQALDNYESEIQAK